MRARLVALSALTLLLAACGSQPPAPNRTRPASNRARPAP
jgi:type IV pilus biogenesis protein CpaD/CtpE